MNFYLNVVSIKRKFFSGYVQKIYITGYNGVLNIYPGHSPLLTMIYPGSLCIFSPYKKKIYVSSGILEVQPNTVNVLPNEAYFLNDLNYDDLICQRDKLNKQIFHSDNKTKNILQYQLLDINEKLKFIQNYNNII